MPVPGTGTSVWWETLQNPSLVFGIPEVGYRLSNCLLYTSDAADERSSVDLGGRRIIKKKKTRNRVGDSKVQKNRNKHAQCIHSKQ